MDTAGDDRRSRCPGSGPNKGRRHRQADRPTLLTSRPALGLQLGLLNKGVKADFSLGETGTWPVTDGPLELTLRVKPVSVGELPDAGSYSALLLMQVTYR